MIHSRCSKFGSNRTKGMQLDYLKQFLIDYLQVWLSRVTSLEHWSSRGPIFILKNAFLILKLPGPQGLELSKRTINQ